MLFARFSHDILFKNAMPSDFPKEYHNFPYGNLWLFRCQVQKTAVEFHQVDSLYRRKGTISKGPCSPFLALQCWSLYCKSQAQEGGHVTFFDRRRRKTLFIVPLCKQCNAIENSHFYLKPNAPLLKTAPAKKSLKKGHKAGFIVPRVRCTMYFLRHTEDFSLPCDPNDIDF